MKAQVSVEEFSMMIWEARGRYIKFWEGYKERCIKVLKDSFNKTPRTVKVFKVNEDALVLETMNKIEQRFLHRLDELTAKRDYILSHHPAYVILDEEELDVLVEASQFEFGVVE